MNRSLSSSASWLFVSALLLVSASLITGASFLATGRGGEVPCGEDTWRWVLMLQFVGLPVLLSSFVSGLFSCIAFRKNENKRKVAVVVFVFQLMVALLVLVIITWPTVIYVSPPCW